MPETRETVCERCGEPKAVHIPAAQFGGGYFLLCPTTAFKAKPAPLKAKPGVTYRRVDGGSHAYGTFDGRLAYAPGPYNQPFLLTPDWQEVEADAPVSAKDREPPC